MFKKGDRNDLTAMYKPITLSSNIGKIFMKILENRLKNIMNFNQPIEQVGFRSGFSTYQLIEKSREYQIDIFLAFFDNRKAFDTIEQSYIFKSMLSQGINSN